MLSYDRGLIIVEPYGSLIKNRSKSLIVKTKYIKTIIKKNLLLIENKIGLSIIQLGEPDKIDLNQFDKLKNQHQILESDRVKWWNQYEYLYAYPIIKQRNFKIPVLLNYPQGPQITVKPENITIKKIYIGMSGYSYPYMYPKGTKNLLKYYANYLNSVEINSTYYFPKESYIRNLSKVKLIYSIKVNRFIIYSNDLDKTKDLWNRFYALFEPISDQIKCFLFQYNKNYRFTAKHLSNLKSLSKILNPKHRYVFEFRNSTWFDNDQINELFLENSWILVIVNVTNINGWTGDLSDGFTPSLKKYVMTTDDVYIRMHGSIDKYIGSYSNSNLDSIVKFVQDKPITNAYIYFNNTDDSSAFPNAIDLISKFNPLNIYI